jgi:hypothetical protein
VFPPLANIYLHHASTPCQHTSRARSTCTCFRARARVHSCVCVCVSGSCACMGGVRVSVCMRGHTRARARTHTHTHTGLLECFPGAGRTSSTLRLRVLSGSFSGLMVARWRWRSFVMLLRPFTSCALAALPDTDSQKSVPSKLTIYSHYVDSF